jgi:hypothetical protein
MRCMNGPFKLKPPPRQQLYLVRPAFKLRPWRVWRKRKPMQLR